MESHVLFGTQTLMELRKVLKFNTVLGFTIPKTFIQHLEIDRGDYVEVSLGAKGTIIIKKHQEYRPNKERYQYGQIATG